MARQVLDNGVILPSEYSDDWYDDMTSNLTKLDDVIGSDSEKLSSADVGAAALSNNYNDLDNLPTIPTVNDATLTIQKNGVDVQTFTANASSNVTANITVPTKTSDITNDSNFVDTSNSAVSSGITSAKVTDYDTHIADTDIHVTTADKAKWNNGVSQAYVLRYSSTAITDNSTIAYSTLDNTDNIKVSDKIIDSDGKIFRVVSIDSANETVTVGSALIDLALDANVMHLSGNETANGEKTFSSNITSPGLRCISSAETSGQGSSILSLYTTLAFLNGDPSITARLNFRILGSDGSKSLYPHETGQCVLGLTSRRYANTWTNAINSLNPGALSLPDLNNALDISGYITVPNTHNTYTPPVNGWISIILKSTSGACACFVYQGDMAASTYSSTSLPNESEPCVMCCLPVVGNVAVSIDVKGANAYVLSAKFYPCLGNV